MLWFVIIGIMAGCLVGNVMKDGEVGLIGDLAAGVTGGFTGAYLFKFFGVAAYGTIGEVTMVTMGAIVLLFIARLFQKLPLQTRFDEMRTEIVNAERRLYGRACTGNKCDE